MNDPLEQEAHDKLWSDHAVPLLELVQPVVPDPPYRPRCRGDCCRAFSLIGTHGSISPELIARMGAYYGERMVADPDQRADIDARYELTPLSKDADIVADMVVPLGIFTVHPHTGTVMDEGRPVHLYSCRHLTPSGDCGNYDGRPALCRSYGTAAVPCEYASCACRPRLTG